MIAWESAIRLYSPFAIRYSEATIVAVVGLAVNLASAWLLFERGHHHDHGHQHINEHRSPHHEVDLNLGAAYRHVIADAQTSVLAIAALLAGRHFGWSWLDSVIGIVERSLSQVVARSSPVLCPDSELELLIRRRLEQGSDRVSDLDLWRIGPGYYAAIVSLVADCPQAPQAYKDMLTELPGLSHVTVEVQSVPADGTVGIYETKQVPRALDVCDQQALRRRA